jgi:hypothetical protein
MLSSALMAIREPAQALGHLAGQLPNDNVGRQIDQKPDSPRRASMAILQEVSALGAG